MPTAYTSLLGLALPVTGELQGTWGTTVNDAITGLLDTAVAGTTILSADTDVTLSTTTGAANQARQAILLWTANGTVTRNITAPAQSKTYVVINATAGTQSIVIRGVGPTSGVTLLAGERAIVAWNGSDFVKVSTFGGSSSFTNVTVTGTTTLSGLTASTALALNGSKEVVSVTNTGTGNNVLSASPTLTGTVAGASLQLSSLTSGRVTYAGASGLLQDSANFTFNGTDLTVSGAINATTFDMTNLEVTNIKAKDGTAAASIADSTGVVTVSQAPVMSALTASQAVFTTAGKALVSNAITGTGNVVMSASPTLTGTVSAAAATLSGNLTLSGGTANGVLYLDGSKVATSGSALNYNGTNVLQVVQSSGTNSYFRTTSGTVDAYFGVSTSGLPTGVVVGSFSNNDVVFYQNSSEAMRLTSTGLGIGTSSPGQKLTVQGGLNVTSSATLPAAQGSMLFSYESAVNRCYMGDGTGYSFAFSKRAASVTTDLMTLTDTGNLGIGTSSPGAKLHVSNGSDTDSGLFTGLVIGGLDATNARTASLIKNTSTPYDLIIRNQNFTGATSGSLIFQNGSTEQMRLDSSGNLGLGVTPSAWQANWRGLQVGGSAALWSSASGIAGTYLSNNNYFNGTNRVYISNGTAAEYAQLTTGAHIWYTAPSGTAGDPISFTQAMTLDSSGNLGIGTSSPGSKLDVTVSGSAQQLRLVSTGNAVFRTRWIDATTGMALESNNSTETAYYPLTLTGSILRIGTGDGSLKATLDASGNLGLGVTPSAWAGKAMQIGTYSGYGIDGNGNAFMANNAFNYTSSSYKYSASGLGVSLYGQHFGDHRWYTAPSGTAGNTISFTQAMTLDASSNLSTYGTDSNTLITVNNDNLSGPAAAGFFIKRNSYNSAYFYINNTAGYLSIEDNLPLVFRTNSTERARITSGGDLLVGTTSTAFTGKVVALQATSASNVLTAWNSATTGDNSFIGFFTDGGTGRGSIDYNRAGGLVRYNTTSDYRAKDIIGPITNSGEVIDSLKVYEGVMKGATQSRPMLIAHEAQEHAPYAVSGVKDEVNEDGTPKFQQIDVSSLVPLLLAEIQSLRARVAALEAQP